MKRLSLLLVLFLGAGLGAGAVSLSSSSRPPDKEFLWEGLHGHWVTVVEVPASLADNEKAFRFGFVDPDTGKLEYGHAYAEEARNFTAAKGNIEKWEWIPDRPFLLVTAPSLHMETRNVPWFARAIITLNYAIYREATDGLPSARGPIIAQKDIGENACGPCALYNCLTWGDAKLNDLAKQLPGETAAAKIRWLIKKYGTKPSEEYGGKEPRYTDERGITWVDLHYFVKDLLRDNELTPVEGNYLDRRKQEESVAHLRRVHQLLRRSLDAGFPPIVSVRSFSAKEFAK